MGTEILRPQDCLIERIRVPPAAISRRRSYANYCNHFNNYAQNSRSSRKPVTKPERPDQRRRYVPSQPITVTSIPRRSSTDDLRMARSSGMVREKVATLRRSDSLDSRMASEALTKKEGYKISVCPDQSMYAGSAFAVSPSPSALPLPSFSKKKKASEVVHDSATRNLRRLLRLEWYDGGPEVRIVIGSGQEYPLRSSPNLSNLHRIFSFFKLLLDLRRRYVTLRYVSPSRFQVRTPTVILFF